MQHNGHQPGDDDLTLLAHTKILIKQFKDPKVLKMIGDARESTRLEDAILIEKLERLKRVLEEAMGSQ